MLWVDRVGDRRSQAILARYFSEKNGDGHNQDENEQEQRAAAGLPGAAQYDLAYLEFDDMGELWTIGDPGDFKSSTSQLAQTLRLIEKRKESADIVVITFIHGWHNNASKYDENRHDKNLAGFKNILDQLATKDPQHAYIGILVAWRGEAIKKDPFVTYWNRRDAANQVRRLSLTEAIFRLMFATKGPDLNFSSNCEILEDGGSRSRFIMIGHSMARIEDVVMVLLDRLRNLHNPSSVSSALYTTPIPPPPSLSMMR
jgi:hypothetical protein